MPFRNEAEPAHMRPVLQEFERLRPTDVPNAGSRLVVHPQATDGAAWPNRPSATYSASATTQTSRSMLKGKTTITMRFGASVASTLTSSYLVL